MSIDELARKLYAEEAQGTLYHYTSLRGIMGIVKSATIQATEVRYFNDAAEMKHTADLLFHGMDNSVFLAPLLAAQLRNWLKERLLSGHMLYVTSFTARGNLLSQWRSYCPSGKGVSLGFNGSKLQTAAARQSFKIAKCVYALETHLEIAETVLQQIKRLAEQKGENKDRSKRHESNSYYDIFEEIEPNLLRIAALVKHPSFHEEQEWRAVSPMISNYVTAPIEYREGLSMLVPFMQFRLPDATDRRIDFEHVVLGPTPNVNISMTSLSNYLSKNGASPRKGVTYCEIPHRSW